MSTCSGDMPCSTASVSNTDRLAILVVDDSQTNLLAFRSLLEPLGHEIVVASSGHEAIECARRQDFAVILLDLMMPTLDGMGTLLRLRELEYAAHTPVIFLTAYDPARPTMEEAYALGALDFITKPVPVELLRAKVSAFASFQLQRRELARTAAALQAKDRQIQVLAHDLRNPISLIQLAAHSLERGAQDQSGHAKRILRATGRMQWLVENLLQFARAAVREVVPIRVRFDLSALCLAILEDMQTLYPTVVFHHELTSGMEGCWDRQQLEQAIGNLLSNAARYGRGEVSIGLVCDEQVATLTISNKSDVIPPDRMEKLFAPFVRGSTERGGVGLGLYIVKQVALAHGGEVVGHSDEAGTRFSLSLPRSLSD